jgi:hypothetical protein
MAKEKIVDFLGSLNNNVKVKDVVGDQPILMKNN